MRKKIKLNKDDWEVLFISENFKIGLQTIEIFPFCLKELKPVMNSIKELAFKFKSKNIGFEEIFDIENAPLLAEMLMEFPDIISKATGLEVEDINNLPINIIIALSSKIIEVNVRAQGGMEKNLIGLLEEVARMMVMVTSNTETSETSSKPSLSQATLGKK